MFGVPFEAKVAEQRELLSRLLGAGAASPGRAVDLGCGPGFQAIALADLGFSPVIAIDTSERLLQELEGNQGRRPITLVRADLRDFRQWVGSGEARVAVCMGDTLTHLPDWLSVKRLFVDVYEALEPGGMFVLTFRDLSVELEGLQRFIPIRSDADRIMTCFLEFAPAVVTVHDLIQVREESGWRLLKSSYQKLRLGPAEVAAALCEAGFAVEINEASGRLHAMGARRP